MIERNSIAVHRSWRIIYVPPHFSTVKASKVMRTGLRNIAQRCFPESHQARTNFSVSLGNHITTRWIRCAPIFLKKIGTEKKRLKLYDAHLELEVEKDENGKRKMSVDWCWKRGSSLFENHFFNLTSRDWNCTVKRQTLIKKSDKDRWRNKTRC